MYQSPLREKWQLSNMAYGQFCPAWLAWQSELRGNLSGLIKSRKFLQIYFYCFITKHTHNILFS